MRPQPRTQPLMEKSSISTSALTCTQAWESQRIVRSTSCSAGARRAMKVVGQPPFTAQYATVAPSMPTSTAPLTAWCSMEPMAASATRKMVTSGLSKWPKATMSLPPTSLTTTPMDLSPMKAVSRPVPTRRPYLMLSGTRPRVTCSTGVSATRSSERPQAAEMARAWLVVQKSLATRLYARKTLGPTDGARPTGRLLRTPQTKQAMEDAKAPLTTDCSVGMPVRSMNFAFTMRLFEHARKAVKPARSSVATVLPRAVMRK
mmetsp:Transcript_6112/g.18849  ORF Transcript_6112/g.18849 Transcript_6112/m.18849 type:complete len:260 (+) Transcript_6112:955-1734(+)